MNKLLCYPVLILIFLFSCTQNDASLPSYLIEEKKVEYREMDFEEKLIPTHFTKEEALEDLEEFIYILETSYSGYEYQKKYYGVRWKRNFRRARWLLNQKEDRLYQRDLYEALQLTLEGVIDGHLSIHAPNVYNGNYTCTQHSNFYYTHLFVEKVDDEYRVLYSKYPEIQEGDLYNDSEEFLFPSVRDFREVFRVGTLSKTFIEELPIKINKEEISLPITMDTQSSDGSLRPFAYSNNQGVHYIKIRELMISNRLSAADQYNQKMQIDNISKILGALDENQLLVLDLRNNNGGLMRYIYPGLSSYLGIPRSSLYPAGYYLRSPYNMQYLENIFIRAGENRWDYDQLEAQNFFKELWALEDENVRYWSPFLEDGNEVLENPNNKNKVIVLVNRYSYSAAEILWASMDPEYVTVVGENTGGAARFVGPLPRNLTNSRILVLTPQIILPHLPYLEDEGVGVFPDYWQTSDELGETLAYLLGQSPQSLSPEFCEIEKEQFFNGGFEWNWNEGFMGWNYVGENGLEEHRVLNQSNTNVPSGEKSLNISLQEPSWASLSQTLTVEPHTLYRISGQFRLEGNPDQRTGGFNFSMGWPRQETHLNSFPMEDWQDVECYVDSGSQEELFLKLNLGSIEEPFSGEFYADALKLERVEEVPPGAELIRL